MISVTRNRSPSVDRQWWIDKYNTRWVGPRTFARKSNPH